MWHKVKVKHQWKECDIYRVKVKHQWKECDTYRVKVKHQWKECDTYRVKVKHQWKECDTYRVKVKHRWKKWKNTGMVGRCATHLKTKKSTIKNTFICVCVCVYMCVWVPLCVRMRACMCARTCAWLREAMVEVFFLMLVLFVSAVWEALLMLSTASWLACTDNRKRFHQNNTSHDTVHACVVISAKLKTTRPWKKPSHFIKLQKLTKMKLTLLWTRWVFIHTTAATEASSIATSIIITNLTLTRFVNPSLPPHSVPLSYCKSQQYCLHRCNHCPLCMHSVWFLVIVH